MARKVGPVGGGGGGGVTDHTLLTNIGTYTHPQIDTHINAVAPHSGHALLVHNHDASYATVAHDHAATYVDVTGDTMTGDLVVPDEVYGPAWNGSLEVPTKNAVYDKVETVVAGGGAYTDEQAQDAVGTILVDTASIDLTYTDATPSITAAAIFGTGAGVVAEGNHTHAIYQPLDSDLTTIAGLTATTNNFMVANASAWASRTPTQALVHLGLDADLPTFSVPASTTISTFGASLVDDADAAAARTTLGLVIGTNVQAQDADLSTIAGLTATTDNVIQSVSSAWASRTPAQLKATLGLVKGDVGLGNVDNTSDATKLAAVITQSVVVQFGNGTDVLTVGDKRRFDIPVGHTLIRWRILSSISGSVVFDVWRDTFANYPPTVADTISTSKPTLSSALSAEDSTITDWTEVGAAGDIYIVNVDSVTSVVDCVLILWYTRALNV